MPCSQSRNVFQSHIASQRPLSDSYSVRKRAARLNGEHASKTNAVPGIILPLSVWGKRYSAWKLNCFLNHGSVVVFSLVASLLANSSPLSGKKRPPRVKYRLAGASSQNTAATVSSGK